MGIGLLGACVFSALLHHSGDSLSPAAGQRLAVAVIGFVLVFLVGFASGPGPLCSLLVNELFDAEARSQAQAVAGVANALSMLLVVLLFLVLQRHLDGFVFLLFLGVLVEAFVYLLRNLPETKGNEVHHRRPPERDRVGPDRAGGLHASASVAPVAAQGAQSEQVELK